MILDTALQILTLDDADLLLRGHVGLICGPAISRPSASFPALASSIIKKFGGTEGLGYRRNGEEVIRSGIKADDLKGIIRDDISGAATFANLKRVAAVRWSAVLSLAMDSSFEAELRRVSETRPSGITVTEVVKFPLVLPLKTTPIFKLLGSVDTFDFVYSETSYAIRRATWRHALRSFSDRVKAGPAICLGLENCGSILIDVVAELIAEQSTIVTPLVLVKADFDQPMLAALAEITTGRAKIAFIDATLTDVITRLRDVEIAGPTLPLPFGVLPTDSNRLAPFQDLVAIVNSQLKSPIRKDETSQLLDLLFSPALARWDPFCHQLDFRRSLGGRMFDALQLAVRRKKNAPAYVLIGGAASGKTTIAKRVAFDLAAKGHFVMWFRRTFYPNVQTMLSDFFRVVGEVADKSKRFFFFVDDPVGMGSTTVRTIATAAEARGVKCTFVLIVRASDWRTREHTDVVGDLDVVKEFALEDKFDERELQALPNYLAELKIFPTKEAAKIEIQRAPSSLASDTLGLLYWLLPKTRQSIESSIQQEYLRLGELAGLSRVVIGAYNRTTEFLRQAYGMVAVSDHYHTPVPVEVLVSAVDVPYGEWLEAVGDEGAAWGLLYGENSPDEDTTVYRPRNAIVTRILVETINGGKLAHSGEVQHLLKLLRACSGSSPIYRQFCVDILVPRSKLSHLDYHDGLQMYDAAIGALPLPDRTLKHQKGLWMKDKANDPLLAKSVLEEALATEIYPYTDRGEAEEHIHTSIAATLLDAADRREIALDNAMPQILRHVDQARADSFFNPRAIHVQANLILRLLSKLEDNDTADTYALVNQAIVAVDSALLVLRNPLNAVADRPTKEIEFLEEITGKIFEKIIPLEELTESAEELFRKYKRQDGFVIAARKLYHIAREKNSGTAYNEAFAYCQRVIAILNKESQTPSADLCSVTVCIYYEWNVNRYEPKRNVSRHIDWTLLCDLAQAVLQSEKYSGDPFYRYVAGFTLAEQHRWSEADALFAENRKGGIPNDQLFQIRAVLLDEEGIRSRVQGKITGGKVKRYLWVDALKKDFNLSRYERWPNIGEIAHAYIGFALAGPLAVKEL